MLTHSPDQRSINSDLAAPFAAWRKALPNKGVPYDVAVREFLRSLGGKDYRVGFSRGCLADLVNRQRTLKNKRGEADLGDYLNYPDMPLGKDVFDL